MEVQHMYWLSQAAIRHYYKCHAKQSSPFLFEVEGKDVNLENGPNE